MVEGVLGEGPEAGFWIPIYSELPDKPALHLG